MWLLFLVTFAKANIEPDRVEQARKILVKFTGERDRNIIHSELSSSEMKGNEILSTGMSE